MAAGFSTRIRIGPRSAMLSPENASPSKPLVCPYCKSLTNETCEISRCFLCRTPHHTVCWQDHDFRCSVFQCVGRQTFSRTGEIRLNTIYTARKYWLWLTSYFLFILAFFRTLNSVTRILIIPFQIYFIFAAAIIVSSGFISIEGLLLSFRRSSSILARICMTVLIVVIVIFGGLSCFRLLGLIIFADFN
jgi:hypothetical protein